MSLVSEEEQRQFESQIERLCMRCYELKEPCDLYCADCLTAIRREEEKKRREEEKQRRLAEAMAKEETTLRRIERGDWRALADLESDMELLLSLIADPSQEWWGWGARRCASALSAVLRHQYGLRFLSANDPRNELESLKHARGVLPTNARPGADVDQAIAILERYWPPRPDSIPF